MDKQPTADDVAATIEAWRVRRDGVCADCMHPRSKHVKRGRKIVCTDEFDDGNNKSRCFACLRDVGGGERVKVQQGIGADGGSLHHECWTRLRWLPSHYRAALESVLERLTIGEMDQFERTRGAVMTIRAALQVAMVNADCWCGEHEPQRPAASAGSAVLARVTAERDRYKAALNKIMNTCAEPGRPTRQEEVLRGIAWRARYGDNACER